MKIDCKAGIIRGYNQQAVCCRYIAVFCVKTQ